MRKAGLQGAIKCSFTSSRASLGIGESLLSFPDFLKITEYEAGYRNRSGSHNEANS